MGIKYYLAVYHGSHEGWTLREHDTAIDALKAVTEGGETYGNEWKILKELEITVKDEEEIKGRRVI